MLRKIYNNLEEILGGLLLVAVCVLVTMQLLSRYLLKDPYTWTEELSTMLFAWLVMVGASQALKTGEHFALEAIVDRLPDRLQWSVKLATGILVIAFSVVLIWVGWLFTTAGSASITPALEITRTWQYACIPFGGVLMLIRGIELTLKDMREVRAAFSKEEAN